MENKNEGQFRLGTKEQSALFFFTLPRINLYVRYYKSTQVINIRTRDMNRKPNKLPTHQSSALSTHVFCFLTFK